jgi:hypothetical protein
MRETNAKRVNLESLDHCVLLDTQILNYLRVLLVSHALLAWQTLYNKRSVMSEIAVLMSLSWPW